MKLRLIKTVNFQRSEAENFSAIMKLHPDIVLGPDDVVCMMSMNRSQLVFMHRTKEVDVSKYGRRRGTANLYNSLRWRIDRSTFEPLMLQDYAHAVGIHLDGWRTFKDMFPNLREKGNVLDLNARRVSRKLVSVRKAA